MLIAWEHPAFEPVNVKHVRILYFFRHTLSDAWFAMMAAKINTIADQSMTGIMRILLGTTTNRYVGYALQVGTIF